MHQNSNPTVFGKMSSKGLQVPNDGTRTIEGQTPFCAKKGTAKAIPFSLVAEAGFEPTTFGL